MIRSKHLLWALALGLTIPVMALAQDSATPPASTPPATTPPAHSAHHSTKPPAKPHVNINTASKEELMTLPTMNDGMADKIIAARPYKSGNQLVEKKIMTKTEYSKISSHITVGKQEKTPKK